MVYASIFKDTHLHVVTLKTLTELLNLQPGNGSLFLQVMFVSNDDNVFKRKVIVRVVLIYPLVQVKERVFIGDVKD